MKIALTIIGVVLTLWIASYRISATERVMDGSVLCDRHGHAVVVMMDPFNQVQLYHLPDTKMSCPRGNVKVDPTKDEPTSYDLRKNPFPPRATVPPFRMVPPNVKYDLPPRFRGA